MATAAVKPAGFGDLLREWRRRRRLSQLDLALEAGVSTRHLSFVETGRARPSPEMVQHHLPARLRAPGLEEAQMAGRDAGLEREVELAEAALGPPGPEEWADSHYVRGN